MRKLFRVMMDAVTLMALADVDYWAERERMEARQPRGPIPRYDPAERFEVACRAALASQHTEEAAAVAQAEAILAAARRRDTVQLN